MIWHKRYSGDYQRDTGHLSLCEHGAYAVLLDAFYSTEKPIPAAGAHRVARAFEKHEREAVDSVLLQFWKRTPDGWVNPRAIVEMAKASAKSEAASRAARAKHESCERRANAPANAERTQSERTCVDPANAEQRARVSDVRRQTSVPDPDQSKIEPLDRQRVDRRPAADTEFDAFWSAYPRKIGKGAARKAWARAADRPHVAAVIANIRAHVDSDQWQREGGQFVPHPATWLNQKRWADTPGPTTASIPTELERRNAARVEQLIERGGA